MQLQSFLEEAADGEKMVKVVEATLDLLRKNHLLDLVDSIIDVGFVKATYSYCLKASGGQEAVHLKETELFVRACCPSSMLAVRAMLKKQLGTHWEDPSLEMARLRRGNSSTCSGKGIAVECTGYALGRNVRRRADKTTGKIQDVKGGLVYIQLDSGDVAKESIDKILGNEWAVFTPKSEAEVLEDLSIYSPSTSVELQAFMLQAEIARQLQKLFDEQSSGIDKLALQTKPQKQLQASQDIPKGKVTLVPLTSKILHKGSSQPSWFEVTTDWTMDARKFYVSSSCVLPKEDDDKIKPLIVPFFFVNYTEDEANVKLQPMQAEKSSSIKIPVFKSTKKIAAGEVVLCYKAKDLKAPPLHLSPSAAKRSSSGGVAVAAKKKAKK
ncbi:unnamed protein product [Symbiodinium sp. CCMP2592]|nr:unnamed protein product [Symbiodinium sp. CCMP2592]